jgi:hypothetical protein
MEFIQKWFSKPPEKMYVGFEDIKYAIYHTESYILMNTLSSFEQECLISRTVAHNHEETLFNEILDKNDPAKWTVLIYGKNCADETVHTKYAQLKKLGFVSVYIYLGGLFEWLLLQDIYGVREFPTTTICRDLLKYRADSILKGIVKDSFHKREIPKIM